MKVQLIYALIHASLCVMLTTAKHSSINKSNHNARIGKSKPNLHSKETEHDTNSNTDKKSGHFDNGKIGKGFIWLNRHKHQDKQRQQEKEERRHHRIISHGRRTCSIKRSVLYEATDEFGDKVKIAPFIGDEGKVRQQVIYETYCMKEHCNCRGVDTLFYESACETNFMLVYANVIKAGKTMWSSVKVRAGCGCIVKEKNHHSNMLDVILTTKQ